MQDELDNFLAASSIFQPLRFFRPAFPTTTYQALPEMKLHSK
jgi:hypothetical protein